MSAPCVVVWEEASGGERQSRQPMSERRALWLSQALMVKKPAGVVRWAEVRRNGVMIYRTEASEWS